jgi:hypothetical protein
VTASCTVEIGVANIFASKMYSLRSDLLFGDRNTSRSDFKFYADRLVGSRIMFTLQVLLYIVDFIIHHNHTCYAQVV